MDLFVTKRNGQTEQLFYDKIIQRLKQLFPNSSIQYSGLVLKIMDQLYNHIQTSKIDELTYSIDEIGLSVSQNYATHHN